MKDVISSKMRLETIYPKTWEEKVGNKIKEYGKVLLFSATFIWISFFIRCLYLILITN